MCFATSDSSEEGSELTVLVNISENRLGLPHFTLEYELRIKNYWGRVTSYWSLVIGEQGSETGDRRSKIKD